ncbi:OmpA family protein [Limibacter armeniacum]|uniref:OmpA family protein n=1 Tax=Limibacter armeniacum TaxID=466084 RepID=UPI002FE58A57
MIFRYIGSLILALLAVAFVQKARAQELFEFDQPRKLVSEEINSGAEEILPLLSPDGMTLYFTRFIHQDNKGGKFRGQDIWRSIRKDGRWLTPEPMSEFNTIGNNAVIGIHKDGKRLYLMESLKGNVQIQYSDLKDGKWQKPVSMKVEGLNDISAMYMNGDGDVLLLAMRRGDSVGYDDLYVCFKYKGWHRFHQVKEGESEQEWWSEPIHLGEKLNSSKTEMSPYLSPDGKTLYFSSNRHGGRGSADIYYAHRLDDTWQNWSEPVNLRAVNSEGYDGYFVMADSSRALLASNREHYRRLADIFVVKMREKKEAVLAKKETSENTEVAKDGENKLEDSTSTEEVINGEERKKVLNKDEKHFFLFATGSSELLLNHLPMLEQLVYTMKQLPSLTILLDGHTDFVGDKKANIKLSEDRTAAIRDFLIAHEITEDRIAIEYHGEEKPLADNYSREGRQQNRRVEFTLMDSRDVSTSSLKK